MIIDNENQMSSQIYTYLNNTSVRPLFLRGDSIDVLKLFQSESIDCCMTSPPYWGKRQYNNGGIGLEHDPTQFINNLVMIYSELHRVLKKTGSFWLNIGDSYKNKRLLGIPWRVAFRLIDDQGWILRNEVIWNKVKGGPDNARDKLGNVHEQIFHFVKSVKGYFYNVDLIRSNPSKSKVLNGKVITATGVSGIRYKRQIELSTKLSEDQKANAYRALDALLYDVKNGKISDFRMIIRGQQRTTHSDSSRVSGRAKEIEVNGFYFLKYHPNGSKPRDVWDIIPEDTQKRRKHYAAYPQDLCKIPLLATCPNDGVILDPFCGTGTTMLVAMNNNLKSIGIDISADYLEIASERCQTLF